MPCSNAKIRGSDAANSSVGIEDKYFDLGGYRLHALMAGQGKPAVVFEAGMGDDSTVWEKVQPAISKTTRTIAYDRPWRGKSDPAPHFLDLNEMADELHRGLAKAQLSPPYILVGHSMGGMIVRVFAHRYPKETAGMVLVDPADENLDDRLHAKMNQQQWDSYSAGLKEHFADPMMKPEALAMESHSEASAAVPQPKVPIIVLSGTQPNARWPNSDLLRTSMTELHTEWVHKTPGAELILVRGAGHYIQIDAPETVIAAIEKVMTETKH